jgi:hypothetical protein
MRAVMAWRMHHVPYTMFGDFSDILLEGGAKQTRSGVNMVPNLHC